MGLLCVVVRRLRRDGGGEHEGERGVVALLPPMLLLLQLVWDDEPFRQDRLRLRVFVGAISPELEDDDDCLLLRCCCPLTGDAEDVLERVVMPRSPSLSALLLLLLLLLRLLREEESLLEELERLLLDVVLCRARLLVVIGLV